MERAEHTKLHFGALSFIPMRFLGKMKKETRNLVTLVVLLIGLLPLSAHANFYSGFPPAKPCGVQRTLDSLKLSPLFAPDSVERTSAKLPNYPDLVYEIKLAAIDRLSPISYDYNQYVKRYIDIYTIERREQVSQMLGLSQLYFPLFDEMLSRNNLPLELKYLAVVESALNPLAVSPSGAVGLWQFLLNTGRMFNLEVNSFVDERMDPIKSTQAACRYLDYLYRIFDDWHLVMAAYNAGPGVVRNAIVRAEGETNFWKLYDFLPEAAQNYVSAFIAATYVMQNASDYGIYSTPPLLNYHHIDTVHVKEAVSFNEISTAIGISNEELRFLNPSFHKGYIPKPDSYAILHLPIYALQAFVANEEAIYNGTPSKGKYPKREKAPGDTNNRQKTIHYVKSGEYLHKIAIDYRCTIEDILIWNPNAAGNLSTGDTLEIWVNRGVLNQLIEDSTH